LHEYDVIPYLSYNYMKGSEQQVMEMGWNWWWGNDGSVLCEGVRKLCLWGWEGEKCIWKGIGWRGSWRFWEYGFETGF
jgi:hypothetical protein